MDVEKLKSRALIDGILMKMGKRDIKLMGCSLGELSWEALDRSGAA